MSNLKHSKMPEIISVSDFIDETRDDFHSPTTSTFVSRIPHCRNMATYIEEALEGDREGLSKMKKSLKAIHGSGSSYVDSELSLSRALEKLGSGALSSEPELGAAFLKFAVVTKEHSNLQKTLMQNLQNLVLFPLDSFLKGDIRSVKGELKRPFDKSLKDYEAKHSKLEKEKKAQARDAGMFRREVTPAEIADETERERRLLQLHLTDYLLKVNEIKTKKGVELVKHLVEYYHALNSYFQDGLKTMEHFGSYVTILSNNLVKIRQKQDDEKRKLSELRTLLRSTSVLEKEVQNLNLSSYIPVSGSLLNLSSTSGSSSGPSYLVHQMQGNKSLGVTKSGYLNKKSEGKMRRVWQKRKCTVQDGVLEIFHGDEGKAPTRVNLLTCQLKVLSDDKKFFDLVSYNRTYHLQSEDEADEWISILLNSKEAAMTKAFDQKVDNDGLVELTQAILGHVHRLPGNDRCADCDSEKEVSWLSVNLGMIVCIDCSGVHRNLGVSVSRIQSISLDRIPPSLLILSASLGNGAMNDILEENLKSGQKPHPTSTMDERTEFIRCKYVDKKWVGGGGDEESVGRRVELAIESDDLLLLVRTWAQGASLSSPLPSNEKGESPLHYAIVRGDLRLVDFLIHNSGGSERKTKTGSTPLHYCSLYGRTEPAKLLLRAGVDIGMTDGERLTALDVARQRKCTAIEDLLLHAMEGKKTLFETVDFDWNLGAEDSTDFSDDETTVLDEMNSTTPDKKRRPCSVMLESPYKSSNEVRSGFATPGIIHNSSTASSISSKHLRKRTAAPPPPSPSNHTRSPSDSLIGKLGLGRLVIPPGEPPLLRKTSIPTTPPSHTPLALHPLLTSTPLAESRPPNEIRPLNDNRPPNESRPLNDNRPPNESRSLNDSRPLNESRPLIGPQSGSYGIVSAVVGIGGGGISNGSSSSVKGAQIESLDGCKKCVALYDCEADNCDEISFRQGEIIWIVNERTEDDNWMEGIILDSNGEGRRGMFPLSFVDLNPH